MHFITAANRTARAPYFVMACATSCLAANASQPAIAGPPVPFATPWLGYDTVLYPEGYLSRASRTADFNGDGIPDLAVVSGSNLAILYGDGEGGFAVPVVFPTILHGFDLEVGDFDNDKDIDIIVADSGAFFEGSTFSLFENQGSQPLAGTAQFDYVNSFAAGGAVSGLTVADFNGDGWLDVAAAHDKYIEFDNSIAAILNDGTGGFQPPQVITLQTGTEKIDSGDLDGDGDADIVVAHKTNRITVVRNNGASTPAFTVLTAQNGLPSLPGVLPNVTLADVDEDGDVDVLYSHDGCGSVNFGCIALFRNTGSPTWQLVVEEVGLFPQTGGAVNIQVGDVTGDGVPDVLAANGTSQAWNLVVGDGPPAYGFLPAVRFRATQTPIALTLHDLDGDSDLDVSVLGRDSLELAVYRNEPTAEPGEYGAVGFVQPTPVNMMPPGPNSSSSNLEVGDIDGDGDLDLVAPLSNAPGTVISIRRNNGDGTFTPPQFLSTSHFAQYLRLRDIDGDGDLDLLWAPWQFSARFRVRYNNGAGVFSGDVLGPVAPASEVWSLEAGDVDADGDLDVLMGYLFTLGVSKNNNGVFAPFQAHAQPVAPSAIATGDFNQDGHLDLLTNTAPQGWINRSLGNGNGTFQTPVEFSTIGRGITDIKVSDLNGDGHLDIAVAYNLDGVGLATRFGDGAGGFLPASTYHGSFSATLDQTNSLVLADANADGFLDAFSANIGSQDISYWKGNAEVPGTFHPLIRLGVGLPALDVQVVDVDDDGALDVLALTQAGTLPPGVTILPGLVSSPPSLPGDCNSDGVVNVDDLVIIIISWGPCPVSTACPADLVEDDDVNIDDLLVVINSWG